MLNLILVEDNPADRAMIQLLFKQTGINYSLKIFNNGEDAINYFGNPETFPSGVVLDLNMPRKNGFEVLQYIRSNSELSNIPVAVLSSSQSIEDKLKVEKENGYFFSKSFKLPEMKQTVQEILQLFH
jgi:two-component system, chemotaxis family, response regulator Rcp1